MSSSHIRNSGDVVREYEQDDHTYHVVRSGPVVRKWDQMPGGAAGVLYEVDTVTRICKATQSVVDCANLKNDPDMAPFITW